MRCTRINFEGYKRLADTSCNVDGNIIAFVGLNEAGKSSLLEGLVWLTADAATALRVGYENRSHPVEETDRVVWATYDLDADDLELIADLDFETTPTKFLLERHKNGQRAFGFATWSKRNPRPFEEAHSRLEKVRARLATQFDAPFDPDETDAGSASALADVAKHALLDPDGPWSEAAANSVSELASWLDEVAPSSRSGKPRDEMTATLLRAARDIANAEHPRDVARKRLITRVPKFVLFEESDRALSTVHPLAQEHERNDPQPALANLLKVADIDLNQLWAYISTGDGSNRESYIETANENLQDFYTETWNQSHVAVRLKVDGHRLEVRLKELGRRGSVTDIEERSDGLRTFIALSAFLASQHLAVPPILLIDEAETHLHYDAQADLVSVLLKNVDATQVFYTTHSPGCLPTDLGTSIRLLSKSQEQPDASILRADFWTNEEPGFAPLLYAMGASAAAFSVCRRAVLSEGPADMVLLPTLIRLATGENDLVYQIAPGLSNAHGYGMSIEEVAASVVYLTDGDDGGRKHRKALGDAGVAPGRIFSLPSSMATEDLVDRAQYVETVNGMLDGSLVASVDLDDGQPIAKSLQDWGKRTSIKIPGHVAVAYALLRRGDALKLTPQGRRALVNLHRDFTAAFSAPRR